MNKKQNLEAMSVPHDETPKHEEKQNSILSHIFKSVEMELEKETQPLKEALESK